MHEVVIVNTLDVRWYQETLCRAQMQPTRGDKGHAYFDCLPGVGSRPNDTGHQPYEHVRPHYEGDAVVLAMQWPPTLSNPGL